MLTKIWIHSVTPLLGGGALAYLERPTDDQMAKDGILDSAGTIGPHGLYSVPIAPTRETVLVEALKKIASVAPVYDASAVLRAIARNALKEAGFSFETASSKSKIKTLKPEGFVFSYQKENPLPLCPICKNGPTVSWDNNGSVDCVVCIECALNRNGTTGEKTAQAWRDYCKSEKHLYWKGVPICPVCNNVYVRALPQISSINQK